MHNPASSVGGQGLDYHALVQARGRTRLSPSPPSPFRADASFHTKHRDDPSEWLRSWQGNGVHRNLAFCQAPFTFSDMYQPSLEGPRRTGTAVQCPEGRRSRWQSPRPVLPDASVCTGDARTQAVLLRSRVFRVKSTSFWPSGVLHHFFRVGKVLESLLSDAFKQRDSVARSGWDQDAPSPEPGPGPGPRAAGRPCRGWGLC